MHRLQRGTLVVAGLFLVLVAAQARRPPVEIDVGGPGDARFLTGFRAPIVGQRVSYRWTGPEAELRFHGLACAACTLALRADAGPSSAPLRVDLVRPASGETPVASFDVTPGWRTHKVALSRAAIRPASLAGPTVLGLRTERYRRDADGNEVGFKLDSARLECASASWLAVLTRAALWTWGLTLTWLLLLGLARHLPGTLLPAGRALAHGLSGALALALAVAVALRPLVAGWAAPPMPVTFGLISVALLLPRLAPALRRASAILERRSAARRLAITLALGGLLWSYLRLDPRVGLALAVGALVLTLVVASRPAGGTERTPEVPPTRPALAAAIFLVLAIAFGLRLYRITEIPTGMWRDEARHGLAALNIIEDPHYRPVYVPQADLAAAGIYGFIPGLLIFGAKPWALRGTSALFGALTVVPLMLVARRLTGRIDAALLAGGLLAASAAHATVSRLGFVGELHPLCELTGLALLACGLASSRRPIARVLLLAGGGAFLALALQMYQSGRLAPLLAALFVVLTLGLRPTPRGLLRLWPAVLAFAVVAFPVARYTLRHPDVVQARTAETFILSHASVSGEAPLAALDRSVGRHLLMLHVRGDDIGRHNLPRQPHLDPVTGLGFLAGLVLLVWRRREGASAFLLAALVLTTVPSLLSIDGPRTTRIIDLLPYAAIAAALGWTECLWPALVRAQRSLWPVPALTLLAAIAGAWSLFVAAPRDPSVWQSFDTVHTRLGLALQDMAASERAPLRDLYLPVDVQPNEVVRFLAHGLDLGTYDASHLWPRPAARARVRLVVRQDDDERAARALAAVLGRTPHFAGFGPPLPDGQPAFRIVTLE